MPFIISLANIHIPPRTRIQIETLTTSQKLTTLIQIITLIISQMLTKLLGTEILNTSQKLAHKCRFDNQVSCGLMTSRLSTEGHIFEFHS